ncbi:MAG: hypothetical protein RO009_08005 [Pseudorhodoplanes sp.]|jgi:nucleoside phosphorylase|nr:hypothetical protein [Pseudorhodoplanes sp.]
MTKRAFDILLVIPLEEELLEVQKVFKSLEDLSTDTTYRHWVETGDQSPSMLVVQQQGMGRTSARDAVESAFDDFDFSLVICLGIAGSLTNDLNLCDVCYSYEIYDVYDNTKAYEGKGGELDIAFSPNHEKCYEPIVAAINFIRTDPKLQDLYAGWQLEREAAAKEKFPNPVVGRGGAPETIAQPKSKDCKVVCAAVSKSEQYNKKIINVDRKIFAIETESGGIQAALRRRKAESLTIRGISDYADLSKDQLEASTAGNIRSMAAGNAASFLKLQFSNPRFKSAVERIRSMKVGDGQSLLPLASPVKKDITTLIAECAESIETKLRQLSPEFKLLEKGYRLPVPRMRNVQYVSGLGTKFSSSPEEVRDALEKHGAILLSLAKNYPDDSLPWVIASDLLTAVVGGKQLLPVVVDGDAVRPPRLGLIEAAHWDFSEVEETEGAQLVFIIDGPVLGSKSKLDFLIKQIKARPASRFIIISKDEARIISESELAAQIKAEHYLLSNVSFNEITHFVEKNFDMTAAEAEVIALRLNDTFNSFDLSAHPTYFAGISKELLNTLLQANRRAELIQLAVDGFLSLVVAADKAAVKLTRTTRVRFLQMIVTELKLEKRSLSRGDVVAMAADLAKEYGYDIDATGFVLSFVDSGILHFVDERVAFSLPFVESYLLAVELTEAPKKALAYFDLEDDYIDLGTFDIYCEIKPSPEVIEKVMQCVERGRDALALSDGQKHVLLTDAARPAMLAKTDRLRQIEERFHKLSDDVRSGRGDVKRKQKMLDIADRLREAASDRSGFGEEDQEEVLSEDFKKFTDGIRYWTTGSQMLGSAAEHLRAETKERLSGMLVELLSLLAHVWIELYTNVDFDALRKDFTSDENLKPLLNGSEDKADLTETRRQVESMADLLEFSILAAPLRRLLHILCERARLRVLAVSVEKAVVTSEVEKLAHALWLADIDGKRGHNALMRAMKDLPPSPFLRIVVATHLMTRVYWNQSEMSDRLRFLDAAEIALGPVVTLQKGEIIRYIEANAPKTAASKT